jgi:hypothetical protein
MWDRRLGCDLFCNCDELANRDVNWAMRLFLFFLLHGRSLHGKVGVAIYNTPIPLARIALSLRKDPRSWLTFWRLRLLGHGTSPPAVTGRPQRASPRLLFLLGK